MARQASEAVEYHSNDFEWEALKQEIEDNPDLRFHVGCFNSDTPQLQQQQRIERQEEHIVMFKEDSSAWQSFHKQHSSGKFFKERRYLLKEFPELDTCEKVSSTLLEVGCGAGSSVIPILRSNKNMIVYACDCSADILDKLREFVNNSHIVNAEHRFYPFHCDFASSGFPLCLKTNDSLEASRRALHDCFMKERLHCAKGVDFVSLIFTLSAVTFTRMPDAVKECYSVLKPGGLLFFRDYGLYDMTMLRFEPHKKVGFREYMRSDGTRSYFFCLETVRNLFLGAGFVEVELQFCCVNSANRRKGQSMKRVWVHGKFRRPQ